MKPKEFRSMRPLERLATIRAMSADAIEELILACSTAAQLGAVEDTVRESEALHRRAARRSSVTDERVIGDRDEIQVRLDMVQANLKKQIEKED